MFNITITHRLDPFDAQRLDWLLQLCVRQQETIMAALDELKANVEANTSAVQSAVALLGNLKTALDAAIASGDMGQVQALSDQIGKNDADLAAAVAANTPAAS